MSNPLDPCFLQQGNYEALADPTNLGFFTFVSDVTDAGTLNSIAVEPRTKVSTCFAAYFGNFVLPKPPSNNYPIVVEVQIE
jgi:hypothetical protein